jgi:hypothetical protein
MFTVEVKIKGGLVGVLHVQNSGFVPPYVEGEKNFRLSEYRYEYYEPEVGVSYKARFLHLTGKLYADSDRGLKHVIKEIFTELDKES